MNYLSSTRSWIEKLVIGYNLCPFAAVPFRQNRIRYRVSESTEWEALLTELVAELSLLAAVPETEVETSLLIHPQVLTDFDEYLAFVDRTGEALRILDLEGVIQIATFHPDYVFADAEPDDPANYTNRSPYPMLHLIREASVERAVETYPDIEEVPKRNVETLRKLGSEVLRLMVDGK